MKFAIKSEKLAHKDQIVELDFSSVETMKTLQSEFSNDTTDHISKKYDGRTTWVKFLGTSRINGLGMFQVDTTQMDLEDDRNNKISEILK
jgi:hypothetical protein